MDSMSHYFFETDLEKKIPPKKIKNEKYKEKKHPQMYSF